MSVSGDNTSPDIGPGSQPRSQPPPLPRRPRARASPRRPRPAWALITSTLAGALALYLIAACVVAPPVAKNILEKQLSKNLSTPETPREARIERVRLNPLTLSAAIENLAITASGHKPLVRWRNLYASLDLRTFFTREWRFRKIALDGFDGHIAIASDGKLNFADLLATSDNSGSAPAAPPSGNPAILRINELAVTDAHLDYADASLPQPFATQLGPMSFTVRDFQTGGPGRAPGEFTAATESGETLSWRGTLAIAPLASQGEIRIGNLAIKKYTPFYGHHVRFDVLAGTLDVTLRYEIEKNETSLAARATESGVTLHDVRLAERGQTAPVIAVRTLDIAGISIDSHNNSATPAASQTLRVDRLAFDSGTLTLRRDAHGIGLAELFAPARDTASPVSAPPPSQDIALATSATTAAPRFEIAVGELALRDITVGIEDTTLEKPMRAQITIDAFDAKKFSLEKLDSPLALALSASLPENGTLNAGGELAVSPLRGKINVELAAPLSLAREHVANYVNLRIDSGTATASATITIDPATGITIAGDAAISGFAAADSVTGAPLQTWKQLDIRGATFAAKPSPKLTLDEIALDGAVTQLALLDGGKLNLANLVKNSGSAQARANASAPGGAAPPLQVAIAKVTLANSRIDFSDTTIRPAVRLTLGGINGTIASLSSQNLAHADVDLRAKIDDTAPVSITGQINPLSNDVYSDLKLTLRDAQLTPLGPYIAKYAGRALARGTLNIDVSTKVSQRFLDSANVITLDQFELGAHTGSPDATKLPIGLAVALLRDRNGKIVLDVPVKGSFDDPDFKYGRAVWRAVGNLLIKTATAPFTLLTALVGGSAAGSTGMPAAGATPAQDKDYSIADFDAGAPTPNAEGRQKLKLLAAALRERPALQLTVSGAYDDSRDRLALQSALLIRQLKQEYWAELGGAPGAQAVAAAEHMEIPVADEPRMLERLYQRKFLAEERANLGTPSAAPNSRMTAQVVQPGSLEKIQETFLAEAGEAKTSPMPGGDEMRARLLETIQINDRQLHMLASVRAEAVKNFLVAEGVEPGRIALADAATPKGALANLELR